jgi:hypothetical protein
MKYTIEKTRHVVEHVEVEVLVGDVFRDSMKGWELHVKELLSDGVNVVVWSERASHEEAGKPLAERTKDLMVKPVQDLVTYYTHLRGGRYFKANENGEPDEGGSYQTIGAELVRAP